MISLYRKAQLFRFLRRLEDQRVKYEGSLILKMYGALNELNLHNENRYILCNFLDQNSKKFNLNEDIYISNNQKTLNQLFLLAFRKAKDSEALLEFYEEYKASIGAIMDKKEFNKGLLKFK